MFARQGELGRYQRYRVAAGSEQIVGRLGQGKVGVLLGVNRTRLLVERWQCLFSHVVTRSGSSVEVVRNCLETTKQRCVLATFYTGAGLRHKVLRDVEHLG